MPSTPTAVGERKFKVSTQNKLEPPDFYTVFVHAGAGYHSQQNESQHLRACQLACKAAISALKNGAGAVEGVEAAIKILEDDGITNSGYGSNLTCEGRVECDASIMDNAGRSGAVGASSSVTNPISLARVVLKNSIKPLSMKRVPPIFIVGEGVEKYAIKYKFPTVKNDTLVSPAAKLRYDKWMKELEIAELRYKPSTRRAQDAPDLKFPLLPGSSPLPTPALLTADVDIVTDTVGAICIDRWGRIAAGSSSGGIGMKHSGRVGPAALVGIGTWVKDTDGKAVAVVTSGTGEHMSPTLIASTACNRLYEYEDELQGMKDVIEIDFMSHPSVTNASTAGALGLIAIKAENISDDKRMFSFIFGHSTDSMALASMSINDKHPKVIMSRSSRSPKLSIGGYSQVLSIRKVEPSPPDR